jgi:hypothetical protein
MQCGEERAGKAGGWARLRCNMGSMSMLSDAFAHPGCSELGQGVAQVLLSNEALVVMVKVIEGLLEQLDLVQALVVHRGSEELWESKGPCEGAMV